MSTQQGHKFQNSRPNRHKPSVVKEYGFWWAKAYDKNNHFRAEMADTHAEALDKALSLIAGEGQQQ
jgi:hypothetical protein